MRREAPAPLIFAVSKAVMELILHKIVTFVAKTIKTRQNHAKSQEKIAKTSFFVALSCNYTHFWGLSATYETFSVFGGFFQ